MGIGGYISIVVAVLAVIMSFISLIMNAKKDNSSNGFLLGEMNKSINNIEKKVDELAKDYKAIPEKIFNQIADAIKSHVEQYHKS